jgi:hypothetical protein
VASSQLPRPDQNVIMAAHRCFNDIINARLADYPARRQANSNMEINVKYLMNELTEEEWQKLLEQRDTRFERKKEIGQILTMFGHVGADIMRQLENTMPRDMKNSWNLVLGKQLYDLRKYTNKSLEELGKRMICAFPQIDRDWEYVPCRKEPVNDDAAITANPYNRTVNQHAYESYESRRIPYVFPTEKV